MSDIQRYKFHIPDKLTCSCQYMEDDEGAYVLYEDYLKEVGKLKEEIEADDRNICDAMDTIAAIQKRLEVNDKFPDIDGIYCRDETIKLLEKKIDSIRFDLYEALGKVQQFIDEGSLQDSAYQLWLDDLLEDYPNALKENKK